MLENKNILNNKVYISVFIISFCSLGFEIAIVRIFSLIFAYYFVFLSVAIAMLGLGLGGLFASLIEDNEKYIQLILYVYGVSFSLSVIVPFFIKIFFLHPVLLSVLFLPVFIFSGFLISSFFKSHQAHSGFIYFFDLLGACIGVLSIILLLAIFPPINLMFLFSILFLSITGIVYNKKFYFFTAVLFSGILMVNIKYKIVDISYREIPTMKATKPLVDFLKKSESFIERTYWNSSFRTDVIYNPSSPHTRGIFVDGGAPAIMFQTDTQLKTVRWLKKSLNYLPFISTTKGSILSIGPGGGLDIILARLAEMKTIDAVEINKSIPTLLMDYADFNGNLMSLENLNFVISEGRNYLKRTNRKYDLIYLSLSFTNTTNKLGQPFFESYLHTTEAYYDYLHHLEPDGYVAIICETRYFLLKTVINAIYALKKIGIGIKDAKYHFVIVANFLESSPYKYLFLLKKSSFHIEEIEKIQSFTEDNNLMLEYLPFLVEENIPIPFSSYVELTNYIEHMRQHFDIDISITTDERPFFYNLFPHPPLFLYLLCVIAMGMAGVLLFFSRNENTVKVAPNFMLLGFGFMLVELALMQKFIFFLGYPIMAFSVVLFGLLLGCGIGGFLSQNKIEKISSMKFVIFLISFILCVFFFFLGRFLLIVFALENWLKVFISFLIIIPVGILLGIPFPLLLRKKMIKCKRDIGLIWGVNGFMSVCGSALSMILAKLYGFNSLLIVACFSYLLIYVILAIPLRITP